MTIPGRRRLPIRPSLALAVFLIAAVAFGAAATLIAAPSVPQPPGSGSATLGALDSSFIGDLMAWGIAIAFFLWIGWVIVQRVRGNAIALPQRTLVFILILFVLLGSFVAVGHFLSGSNPSGGHGRPANQSGSPSNPTASNQTNSTIPFGSFGVLGWHIPGWWVYAALLGAGVVSALFLVPFLIGIRTPVPPRTSPPEPETIRATIAEALDGLQDSEGLSPRDRIIRVYARLLTRVTAGEGDLSTLTPREIEQLCIYRLRIRPPITAELTSLFEEARYSTHPLGSDSVVRAERALRQALQDLDARVPVGVTA